MSTTYETESLVRSDCGCAFRRGACRMQRSTATDVVAHCAYDAITGNKHPDHDRRHRH